MPSRQIIFRTPDSLFGDLAVLAFLSAQACDGVLTYVGLSVFGQHMEGNPLVGALVGAIGAGPALAVAKLTAGSLGCVLHIVGAHRVIAALTLVYVAAAVLPWSALLWFAAGQ